MKKAFAGGSLFRSWLINPVLNKEFTLRMRTARSMWTLFFYLLALGFIMMSAIYLTQNLSGNTRSFNPENSKVLFYFLAYAQLGLVSFMAPGLTAGVISGEREKQTLNLLLTTQQSSSTIILSKLVSSLSYMIVIVLSTIPIYCMVFLYGGVSPKQLALVFVFYVFMMFVLGSFGILFSTLLKRTMMSVIATYGVGLFIYAGSAILYFVMMGIMEQVHYNNPSADYGWIVHFISWNPAAAMLSILEPSISAEIYNTGSSSGVKKAPIQLWQEFMLIYTVLGSLVLWISIRKLRPRLKKRGK